MKINVKQLFLFTLFNNKTILLKLLLNNFLYLIYAIFKRSWHFRRCNGIFAYSSITLLEVGVIKRLHRESDGSTNTIKHVVT
jgi:uncharacterized ion transporter superfamily protein YfcC